MGAIAIRVLFQGTSTAIPNELINELFALMPKGIYGTGVNDDVRLATRFHSKGIDIDLSIDRAFGAVRDTSITDLAARIQGLFKGQGTYYVDTYVLRAGDTSGVTPISTLPEA